MKREANTFRGTRSEVIDALEADAVYHGQFGREAYAQDAEVAITCVVGGSNIVRVGHLMYEVAEGE